MKERIVIREATKDDVPKIAYMIADDILGSKRETISDKTPQGYYDAFDVINNDSNQFLAIAEMSGKIVGTLQLSYVTNMSFTGARRAVIEGVHVDSSLRGQDIGKYMMKWAISEATKQGCRFVQLTSNKQRKDAHRFYERLGFIASHEGFKLEL